MAKSTGRTVGQKAPRIKTAVMLSPEAFKRLGAACLAEGHGQSEIVEALINRNLSGYVVSVRGAGFQIDRASSSALTDRPSDGIGVNQESAAA
jgi:hypothetical protein